MSAVKLTLKERLAMLKAEKAAKEVKPTPAPKIDLTPTPVEPVTPAPVELTPIQRLEAKLEKAEETIVALTHEVEELKWVEARLDSLDTRITSLEEPL